MEREMRGMNKIVIVSQKTRLQELIERFNTKEQAQFYIEHMGDSFDDYMDEDRCYAGSLTYVRKRQSNMRGFLSLIKAFYAIIFLAEMILLYVWAGTVWYAIQ